MIDFRIRLVLYVRIERNREREIIFNQLVDLIADESRIWLPIRFGFSFFISVSGRKSADPYLYFLYLPVFVVGHADDFVQFFLCSSKIELYNNVNS